MHKVYGPELAARIRARQWKRICEAAVGLLTILILILLCGAGSLFFN